MCNSIIITSSGMRGMRVLWRSHRPVKLNGHLRANLWWTSFDSHQCQAQNYYEQGEIRSGTDPCNTNTDMTRGWGRGPPWWYLQCNHESVLLRDYCANFIFTIGWWAEPKGSEERRYLDQFFMLELFLSSNCPLSLSWQRVNTWNWATWTRGRGETLWRFSLLHFLL